MVVEIANPYPGGQSYTSERKAQEYIARGRAQMVNGQLQFVDRPRLSRQAIKDMRQAAGMVFWNGSDSPLCMHRPGEVRS